MHGESTRAFFAMLGRRGSGFAMALGVSLVVLTTGAALAQFPGGGGQGGPGDGGGRDFGRGGDSRGGDRRGGNRGFGGFNPEDYLKQMDANGNGTLEPSEIPDGRARMFLEWTAREGGIDLSKPVPIEKLQESMQAARERMGRGGMGGMGGRPGGGGGDSGRGDRSRGGDSERGGPGGNRSGDPSSNGQSPAVNKPAPQVAGFGSATTTLQPRGFGGGSTTVTAVTPSGSSASPAVAGPPSGAGPVARDPRSMAAAMIKEKDQDGNGVLESEKGEKLGSTFKDADTNKDGKITVDELAGSLSSYANKTGNDASSVATTAYVSPQSAMSSSTGGASTSGRKSYRVKSPRERLPGDIPSWFTRCDEDGDGQVLMAEYATNWSEAKVSEFTKYDLNRDGVITAKECLKAERK